MYKIEKHYVNDAGIIKINFVVIDICSSRAIDQFDSYITAEAYILTKLLGDQK